MTHAPNIPVVNVRPGKIFASREPALIRTLLGSCVAVCLCDRPAGIGGMNHITLPGEGYAQDPMLPARYGIHAMELLINAMHKLGSDRRRLEAMAFGGANVLPLLNPSLSVAQANITFVLEFLNREGITLVHSQWGGDRAMQIAFLSSTGEVSVQYVGSSRTERIAKAEARHLSSLATAVKVPPDRQVTIF